MGEHIYKLQPERTVHLRGFDHLGASAAVHGATGSGFKVTGSFADASDFAVVMLWDADNFYEHPRLKYLPDFEFGGMTLDFVVKYTGLMPLDSRRYATIDWPYLDATLENGAAARVRLSEYAVAEGDEAPAAAAGEFEIEGAGLERYDRVSLWYQNLAFDYLVPGPVSVTYPFYAGTPTTQHQIGCEGQIYVYVEQEGDTSAKVAAELIALVNAGPDPNIQAEAGENEWEVKIRAKGDDGGTVRVWASLQPYTYLHKIQAATVARALAAQINTANYFTAQTLFSLQAEAVGPKVRIRTRETGAEGNLITMYAVAKNERLKTVQESVRFSGGRSAEKLRVHLDFAALGLSRVRRMWLTLAPRLAEEKAYEPEAFEAEFTEWTVGGAELTRRLRVPGAGSVLVGGLDVGCEMGAGWTPEPGFYVGGMAWGTHEAGRVARVRYRCEEEHEVWLGTSLFVDRGKAEVWIDGVYIREISGVLPVPDPLNPGETAVVTRRLVAAGLAAGEHVVEVKTLEAKAFYFESVLAATASGGLEPLEAQTFQTPALDYSTDHTYKLPPARILWMLRQLGATGPLNEYIGVFWWNQRRRVGGEMGRVRVTFGGEFAAGDGVFVKIGSQVCGKTVLMNEGPALIAKHFAWLINGSYVGVWAKAEGPVLTVEARSAAEAYGYPFDAWTTGAGTALEEGELEGGEMGRWEVDAEGERVVNAGAEAWHKDLYELCAAEGRAVTTAVSMELVEAPEGFAARYADGTAVETATGFGDLRSAHCAFRSEVLAYQKRVFGQLAGMMRAAGLTPRLQCGEFVWWYFTNWSESNPAGGMAYYDSETVEAAAEALGRPLHVFRGPDEDPGVNGGVDANWLRGRLRDYAEELMGAVRMGAPETEFEVLWPYDVNAPEPAGVNRLGGRLNRRVNLPIEWESHGLSGFDRFKIEALDFGAWSRDLDLAQASLRFGMELGWPAEQVRAMIPVFRGGYPWSREIEYAERLGMGGVHLWAFDHVCLYGWMLTEELGSRACRMG